MTNAPTPGPYKHYKRGDDYTVIDVVFHSETQEALVLYRAEYGERQLWVRPLEMFVESVVEEGQQVPRFRYVGD
jgi:hypothetical protein